MRALCALWLSYFFTGNKDSYTIPPIKRGHHNGEGRDEYFLGGPSGTLGPQSRSRGCNSAPSRRERISLSIQYTREANSRNTLGKPDILPAGSRVALTQSLLLQNQRLFQVPIELNCRRPRARGGIPQ